MSTSKVWFITGASSGFGRLMTKHVLEQGDSAVATLRKPEVLADLATKYPTSRLLVLPLDVTEGMSAIPDAFAEAHEVFGRIDVVFNNAGSGAIAEVEDTPDDVAQQIFEVNF